MQNTSMVPVYAVLIPLLTTVVIYLIERRSWQWRNRLSTLACLGSFLVVISQYQAIQQGSTLVAKYPTIMPPLGLSFRMDSLGFLAAAVISGVWFLVTVYATEYMAKEHHKNRFYPFLVLTLAGAMGVVLSGDLFTFFLSFELMSLSAYVLVVHEETEEAMKAGYKYLILTIVGGLALFFAIVAVFELAGTVAFVPGGLIKEPSRLALFAFIGFFIGFGIKAGIVPLHVWLPEAHPVAPSPASALLSGLMLKTGAYGLLRVVFDIFDYRAIQAAGWNQALLVFAAITIIMGSAVAITQDDIKRRLAYSSVGQMGYILLGIGLLQERALIGVIFHIFAHALMKSTLFLSAGAIIYRTGKRKVSEWAGLGREMPLTFLAFTAAAFSMIGIPPMVGFVSKWELGLGALDAGNWGFVVLLLLSSLLNFVYYFPAIQAAFFGGGHGHGEQVNSKRDVSLTMLWPMITMAVMIVLIDLWPRNVALELAEKAAHTFFVIAK